ncbi:MAG TPA: DUF2079 domain-containing protein [bacterium]|nr:DUF2079 domain-containing protein [bacterium]
MNKCAILWKEERPLFLLWALAACAYAALSLFRHWHLESSAYDLGIQDQAVWHYSRFQVPSDSITQFHDLLGDHFSPVMALFAPLYWLCPRVEMVLAAQAFLITLPVFPIFLFARKRLGRFPAYCLAAAYALSWGVQVFADFDVHELAFAAPAAAFAVYFADEEKWAPCFISAALLGLCKEDQWLLAAFLGLVLFLRGQRWKGAVLAFAAFSLFVVEVKWLIPFLGQRPYGHWNYSQLGPGPLAALGTCLAHPFRVLGLLFSDQAKSVTLLCLFLPFLFGSFFSPWVLLAVPLIAERMLSDNADFWVMKYQYNLVPMVVLCLAAADGFGRLLGRIQDPVRRGRILRGGAWFLLAVNLVAAQLPHLPLGGLIRRPFWHFTPREALAPQAFALIPPDASVLAQSCLVPHLSHRQVIHDFWWDWETSPPEEDYVVICKGKDAWPLQPEDLDWAVTLKESQGYSPVFQKEGWYVLKKTGRPSP